MPVDFDNTGAVIGDVAFGDFADTLHVFGSAAQNATVTGNIDFGTGHNILTLDNHASVTGNVVATGGDVAVTVGQASGSVSSLTLTNSTQGLTVSNLTVNDGSTLNVSISQAFNSLNTAGYVGPVIKSAAGTINLTANSSFGINFGSFISTPGGNAAQFVLLEAPRNNLILSNYQAISDKINPSGTSSGQIPFLFTGAVCTYNVGAASDCASGSATDSELVLKLTPKKIGTGTNELNLTGNAANIFDAANAALANDDALGAAIINGVTDTTTAQAAYEGFLPDLSGSSRAVAISLTDPATGPVGARQRALRMYAAQPGGTTMWGQEFAQRLNSGVDIGGYRSTGFGFVLGADSGSPENGRYGGAFTFFSGDQTNKATNFTKTSNEWYMLSGYTDWRGKGLFLDTQVSVGYGNLNGKRYLELTNPANAVVTKRTATSKRAGLLVSGGLTTGAVFTYGGTVLIPQVSIDALTMREAGYTESGGGNGFDLKVQPYYANSARGSVGVTVRQDIDFNGFYVQPQGRVGYRYDFLADPVKLKAAFASVGNQFTLTGPDPERGDVIAGGGLAVTTGAWSLGVNYDYIRGTKGAVSQTGTITLVGRI